MQPVLLQHKTKFRHWVHTAWPQMVLKGTSRRFAYSLSVSCPWLLSDYFLITFSRISVYSNNKLISELYSVFFGETWPCARSIESVNKMSHLLTSTPGWTKLRIQEKENAIPGKRVRAVGMCFYGSGQDPEKSKWYQLEGNPGNVTDATFIEVKEWGQVKATFNSSVCSLLAPIMDNSKGLEAAW